MHASLSAQPLSPTSTELPTQAGHQPVAPLGLAFQLASAGALLKGWLRPHRLDLAQARPHAAELTLHPLLRQRWHSFFRTDPTREIPYLFHTGAAQLLAARVMADLGLNLRHVRPLRQVVQLARDAEPLGQVAQQRLVCRVQRLTALSSDVVGLSLVTTISDRDGQLLATQEDQHAVRRIDTALVAGLDRDRSAASDFAQLRQRQPLIPRHDANLGEWVIGADWGLQFSRLAGTWGLGHSAAWLAQLCGQRAPTLPTACLRDLLVRQLADAGVKPERLAITFCRPVYLNQRIAIVQRDDHFDITDARGVLLAYGRC